MPSVEFRPLDLVTDTQLALPAMQLIRNEIFPYGGQTPEHYLSHYQGVSRARFYSLTAENELLGTGALFFHPTIAIVGLLAVQRQYQWRQGGTGCGYGSALLAGMEQAAQQEDPTIRRLETYATKRTIGFFKKHKYISTDNNDQLMYKNVPPNIS
ncbi:MAG TPA: GNAT family N-acetyltransferase [Candidatus Saccharimonadales bacterium]|nr:GNAT family N-acetyltransferase [Candidatus Saccharimonadales bacterium]